MTFIYWLTGIILAGLAITLNFFKKGGIYNPVMTSTDNIAPVVPTTPVLPTKTPITAPQITKVPITTFCGFIRDYEGKTGDLNYMLNNPGDCRPSPVGYLPQYEPVVIVDTDTSTIYPFHKGKFAKFPTYAIGWEYLCNLVHYTAVLHPNETILQFFQKYAPSGDKNDPNAYAENVAKRCGATVDNTLSEIFGC